MLLQKITKQPDCMLHNLWLHACTCLYFFIIASGFISSTRVVSSTSNNADVLVNVNEQLGCNLYIMATIANSADTQRHPFQTTTMTFRGLSPGDTCNISVVNQDDDLLESVGILCNPPPTNSIGKFSC